LPAAVNKVSRPKPSRHANGVSGRKRRYERTTPVGRARNNLAKATKVLEIVKTRLGSWGAVPSDDQLAGGGGHSTELDSAMTHVTDAVVSVDAARRRLVSLEKHGFVPPKRSSIVVFGVDDQVRVADKHRGKYLEVYPRGVLDRLVVSKILPSGEIAVKNGKVTFIAPKSHLARREGRA